MNSSGKERVLTVASGWVALIISILAGLAGAALMAYAVITDSALVAVATAIVLGLLSVAANGFFTQQPNEARVMLLFGEYKGTVRSEGFHWSNPFFTRKKVSLRARTLNGEKLKVNDKRGNPIEIAVVVVWHVSDTAMAIFDVDDFETYVATQSETALRHVASAYAYDHGADDDDAENGEITLRGNIEDVSVALKAELTERLARAGVVIDDARLSHLAYASEIAQAMLRRQQAEAVIAARRKIVTGAVSMVEMALGDLSERGVVTLDDVQRAALVSNLMVVLCGEGEVHPIVNAGTK